MPIISVKEQEEEWTEFWWGWLPVLILLRKSRVKKGLVKQRQHYNGRYPGGQVSIGKFHYPNAMKLGVDIGTKIMKRKELIINYKV